MLDRRQLLTATAAIPLASLAQAASFPSRAVTIVVAYPPGGPSDVLARAIAEKLSRTWGQPVVVDNKSGANGIIATEAVMRAAPDGHTILMHLTGYIQNVSLYRKVPYDPFKDLSPVTQLGTQAMGLAVSQSSRFTSFSALADAMKMTPSEFSYGSFGVGSTGHIFGELLKSNLEVSIPHIPYRGESLMLPDLLAGRVSLGFVSAAAAVNRQRDGTLRILAISGPKRHPQLPQVPTLDEVGMKGFNVVGWYGLFVPKDTAAHTVAKIAEDTRKALSTPDIADRMKDLSIEPTGTSPAEFAKLLRTDYSRWDDLIKKFQIVAE